MFIEIIVLARQANYGSVISDTEKKIGHTLKLLKPMFIPYWSVKFDN